MEFYSHSQAWHNLEHCFNSQRDGILPQAGILYDLVGGFQFPTGWNSTKSRPDCSRRSKVSIPNGMEFYLATLKRYARGGSFNSQRDGILLCPYFSLSFLLNCFNSQRDGILLKRKRAADISNLWFQFPTGWNSTLVDLIMSALITFQFPTGWNSTHPYCRLACRLWRVSIPNGMEFYLG